MVIRQLLLFSLATLASMVCRAQGAAPADSIEQRAARLIAKRAKLLNVKFARAAEQRQLKRVFRRFYQDSTGQFYLGRFQLSDENPEAEEAGIVVFLKCPPLDSVTFHDVGSGYSADKNGVYHFCFSGHNTLFDVVPGADPATFRVLPGTEAGFDKQHVFLGGEQLPALRPKTLRVYVGPENSEGHCSFQDLYFTDGLVVMKNEKLMQLQAHSFQPPKAYKLLYPARGMKK